VPGAANGQPTVGVDLRAGQLFSHGIDKDLRPAAGQAPQPCLLQTAENLFQTQSGHPSEEIDFRRAETVNINLRIFRLNRPQEVLVPMERELRVETTLQEDLIPSKRESFLDFSEERLVIDDVGLGIAGLAIKCTKSASSDTNVRVVDVPIDVVRTVGFGMKSPGNLPGSFPKLGEISLFQKRQRFLVAQSLATDGPIENPING